MRTTPTDLIDPVHAMIQDITGLSSAKIYQESQDVPLPEPPYASMGWISQGPTATIHRRLTDTAGDSGWEDYHERQKSGVIRVTFVGSGSLDYADKVAELYASESAKTAFEDRLEELGIDDAVVYGTEGPENSTGLLDGIQSQESAYIDLRMSWISVIMSENDDVAEVIGTITGPTDDVESTVTAP